MLLALNPYDVPSRPGGLGGILYGWSVAQALVPIPPAGPLMLQQRLATAAGIGRQGSTGAAAVHTTVGSRTIGSKCAAAGSACSPAGPSPGPARRTGPTAIATSGPLAHHACLSHIPPLAVATGLRRHSRVSRFSNAWDIQTLPRPVNGALAPTTIQCQAEHYTCAGSSISESATATFPEALRICKYTKRRSQTNIW